MRATYSEHNEHGKTPLKRALYVNGFGRGNAYFANLFPLPIPTPPFRILRFFV
jgi:hypothetical protein